MGSATLPVGQYTISGMEMSDGNEYFVVRGAQTAPVTLQARRIDATDGGKTQVIFSREGESWHFENLFLDGNGTAYEFKK